MSKDSLTKPPPLFLKSIIRPVGLSDFNFSYASLNSLAVPSLNDEIFIYPLLFYNIFDYTVFNFILLLVILNSFSSLSLRIVIFTLVPSSPFTLLETASNCSPVYSTSSTFFIISPDFIPACYGTEPSITPIIKIVLSAVLSAIYTPIPT